jgi:putative zinc finger protein
MSSPVRCESIQDRLVDYYYRDLPPEERRESALHLGSCAGCALEYCRLEADLAGLRDLLDDGDPSPGVKTRLAARVRAEFGGGPWSRLKRALASPLPAYQAAMFASAVALAAVLLVVPRTSEPPPPSAKPPTVIDRVDASTIVSVDPDVL